MITFTGRQIGLELQDIPSERDIAVGLGRICRFAGAIWFTDLAHSILVATLLDWRGADHPTWAWGLLHEADEVVTGDVPRPFKPEWLAERQRVLDWNLAEYFGLRSRYDAGEVARANDNAGFVEAVALGLPGYAAMIHTLEGRYRRPPQDQIDLVQALAASDYNNPARCTDADSSAVRNFELWLKAIRDGRVAETRERVRDQVAGLMRREVPAC